MCSKAYPTPIGAHAPELATANPSRILLVSAELAPIAAVGGVAEYVLGLAAALTRAGHDVRVILPCYAYLRARTDLKTLSERLIVPMGVSATEITPVYELAVECPGAARSLTVMLAGCHKHFDTVRSAADIYTWPNHEPWIMFSRAVLEVVGALDWQPQVIHCHDAHTALTPVFVSHLRQQQPESMASSLRTVLTIHNLLSQGQGDSALVAYAGLPTELFNMECFEYYGHANCLKAGLLRADQVNTVSKTYADEICRSDEYGFGLSGVLQNLQRRDRIRGIVNGIDDQRWAMPNVEYFGPKTLTMVDKAKRDCRRALFAAWKWTDTGEPILGLRSRWDLQKGVGLLATGMAKLLSQTRVVLVTWGLATASPELRELWDVLTVIARQNPDRLKLNPPELSTPESTAMHYAVADYFLMPSRYEPCGLVQMECQRYGALPIVRHTGGLADTVSEVPNDAFPSPNGFVFDHFDTGDMTAAVTRAIKVYHDTAEFSRFQSNALAQHNGWETRVAQYEALYTT